MATDPPSITIRADELRTVREAMRDFSSLLAELEEGDVEKLVLTQRNRMRAVVISIERWSELERARAGADAAPIDGRTRIPDHAQSDPTSRPAGSG